MQRKLMAVAIAGALAAPLAMAQSTVTMYGVLDVGVAVDDAGLGNKTRIMSGGEAGSRIGFKGSEDLGNGLKASFVLETGIAMDTGQLALHSSYTSNSSGGSGQVVNAVGPNATTIFARSAWLGLSGGFGDVKMGRQYTPFFFVETALDPAQAGTVATVFWLQHEGGIGAIPGFTGALASGHTARGDNSVSYTTPNLSGFSAMFLYSTGFENNSATTSAKDGRAWSANATYSNGPLWAGIGYENVATAIGSATTGIEPESKNWIAGASYDFGVVKPIVSYERAKDHDATNTTISDVRVWVVGATAPVGPGKLAVVYANLHDSLHNSADAKQYGLSYSYPLSKRTDVYAAVARISNDTSASYLIGTGNATLEFLNGSPTGAGVSPKAYEVGFRHSF